MMVFSLIAVLQQSQRETLKPLPGPSNHRVHSQSCVRAFFYLGGMYGGSTPSNYYTNHGDIALQSYEVFRRIHCSVLASTVDILELKF